MTKDLNETEWKDVDWIHLAQNRKKCLVLVIMEMNHIVP